MQLKISLQLRILKIVASEYLLGSAMQEPSVIAIEAFRPPASAPTTYSLHSLPMATLEGRFSAAGYISNQLLMQFVLTFTSYHCFAQRLKELPL